MVVNDSVGCVLAPLSFSLLSNPACQIAVWNFGDGSPNGNGCGNIQHAYTVAGNYTVTTSVTDIHGCSGSQSLLVNLLLCAGIHENEAQVYNLKLFPNPFTNLLSLEFESYDKSRSLEICDALGKNVFSAESKEQNSTLNLGFLEQGVYFLQVHFAGGNTIRKICKQ